MLMLFVTLLAIAAGAVAPTIAFRVKRDREEEMIHRGNAVFAGDSRYVKKTGRYPTRLEDLENTNNIRFLRKRYKDPVTGKDFKLLHVGEVQTDEHAGNSRSAAGRGANGGARLVERPSGSGRHHAGTAADAVRDGCDLAPTLLNPDASADSGADATSDKPDSPDASKSDSASRRAGLAALSSPARFLAAALSSAWPASARQRRFASSITRTTTTSGSSSTTQPWTAAA